MFVRCLGKKCSALKCLHLINCSDISDHGLIAVAPKVRLSHLNLSHNHKITDKGLLELIGNSRQLVALTITDCPNITDYFLDGMFNSKKDNRMKKNNSNSLVSVIIRDNSNVTENILDLLSSNAPSIKTLDVSGCANIDITRGKTMLIDHCDRIEKPIALFMSHSIVTI